MGTDKSKYVKLGIFILTGLALFVFALFYIGSKDNLFTKTFNVYAIFKSVDGLSEGNSVQFAGINVGTIQSIQIVASDKVRVNLNIVNKVKEFIKKDSEASINSEGLIGNKVLTISSGGISSASIEDGDSLHTVTPVGLKDILNNLNESTKQAQIISVELTEIVKKVNSGEGTLGQLVNNSSIYNSMDSLMKSIAGSSSNVNKILAKTSGVIEVVSNDILELKESIDLITNNIADITTKMNSSQSLVGTLLTDTVFANNIKGVMKNANQTTANLEMGSFSFYQNMEALKHNFLFKGYFEDIGYWDKSKEERNYISREERILNKENDLNEKEVRLREYQLKLDSLRNVIEKKIENMNDK